MGAMGPFSRLYIVQMTYHKLYNVLEQLSAIMARALKSNTHPWLRVVPFLVTDVTPRKQSCIVTHS